MLQKTLLVILLFFSLCGCKQKYVACSYIENNAEVDIDIESINDDIKSIKLRTCFKLPNSLINDEEKLKQFNEQLSSDYYYEDNNLLVRKENIVLDDNYSLNKTIDYLKRKRFYCE